VKEIKTKEKMEDRIKIDQDQMKKIKTELNTIKNNSKKAEIIIEKLNETIQDIKVIKNVKSIFVYNLFVNFHY